jgi:hypothetical protein
MRAQLVVRGHICELCIHHKELHNNLGGLGIQLIATFARVDRKAANDNECSPFSNKFRCS